MPHGRLVIGVLSAMGLLCGCGAATADGLMSTELTAASFDETIGHNSLWAVKFHSEMCSTCIEFATEWLRLAESVSGVHWGEVNVDRSTNLPLATRFGVLKQGIPNVKLFNLREEPVDLMSSGSVASAQELTEALGVLLREVEKGADGYYQSPLAKLEL